MKCRPRIGINNVDGQAVVYCYVCDWEQPVTDIKLKEVNRIAKRHVREVQERLRRNPPMLVFKAVTRVSSPSERGKVVDAIEITEANRLRLMDEVDRYIPGFMVGGVVVYSGDQPPAPMDADTFSDMYIRQDGR